jgi:hypothetical protein
MVLKNYAVKTTSGGETTPAVLNTWLYGQPDGYLDGGLLNWLAVTRYTHLSRLAGKSPSELEFTKKIFSQSEVDQSIGSGKAPILGLPGHFVLAYGNQGTNYLINDPAVITHTTLPKTSTIQTSNTFTPSHTDLSYMLFTYDPSIELVVKDAMGSAVAGVLTEEFLQDPRGGKVGPALKLLYIPKPASGNYSLEVMNTSPRDARVAMYFYDTAGAVWVKKLTIQDNTDTQFNLKYDGTKVGKSKFDHDWRWVWQYSRQWRRWLPSWGRWGWKERGD